MNTSNIFKMLLFLILASVPVKGDFELFTRAIDDRNKQVDIYAAHTVLLSRLFDNGTLIGFFMNSVIGGKGRPFTIASDVSSPYAVIGLNGRPTVICNDNRSPFVRMLTNVGERLLPFEHFELCKYDYVQETIYLYANETLSVYNLPRFITIGRYYVGNLTDFFVTNGRIYMTNNCDGLLNETCAHGLFDKFIISNSSLRIEISLNLLFVIFIFVLLKYYYLQ